MRQLETGKLILARADTSGFSITLGLVFLTSTEWHSIISNLCPSVIALRDLAERKGNFFPSLPTPKKNGVRGEKIMRSKR